MVFTMKVDFRKEQLLVVRASSSILMDHSIKVASKITPSQGQASLYTLPMAPTTQEYGERTGPMEEESKLIQIIVTIKDSSKMVKNMVRVSTLLLTAKSLREHSTRVIFQVQPS